MQTVEKYKSVKELVAAIHDQHGIAVSSRFVRDMLRSGVPRVGWNAKLSDLMEWWRINKDFSPRSRRCGLTVVKLS